MRLQGKRAFITAAGQGIGRAIAEAYVREGAIVTATDLKADLLDGLNATTFALDVTDKAALQKAVTDAAPDILVNCAGVVHAGTITEASDADFDFAFALNVKAQFHSMQAALPGMVERGGGTIVNIASVASSIIAAPGRCVYGASKAAVIGLTKAAALDLAPHGIRVNAVSPAFIGPGEMWDRQVAEQAAAPSQYYADDPATVEQQMIGQVPLRRVGSVDEVAGVVAWLLSEDASYVTGENILVTGGIR